jgi:DNA topoisomerase III
MTEKKKTSTKTSSSLADCEIPKGIEAFAQISTTSSFSTPIVALNVAEKPSVAKAIADYLCKFKEGPKKLDSLSKYNPVFQFKAKLDRFFMSMIVTSVCGHIKEYRFPKKCKDWKNTDMKQLFKVPLEKYVVEKQMDIVKNVQRYAMQADVLILWLDCDREGEAIAFDVIDLCKQVKPNIMVKRAHFSALTKQDITQGCTKKLSDPDKFLADAVFAR